MEQFRKFLRTRGFALVLAACLLAAAAAGVWAVRTVRDELKKNLDGLNSPDSTAPGIDEGLQTPAQEDQIWQQQTAPAANSHSDVPKPASSTASRSASPATPKTSFSSSASSSGAASGSGSVLEPSELQTASSPASSSAAPASTRPVSGRVLNAYSGDELVYSKTLGDWRTHNGVDLACEQGEAVCAPTAGKIVETGSDGGWGPVVSIEDGEGRVWRLCGVTGLRVKNGETVTAGQTLGKAGSVSCECAEESHIHVEVRQGDTYLDPAKLMG